MKHGLYYEAYDDGTIVKKGMYRENVKEGEWIESIDQKGHYEGGKKQGKWASYNPVARKWITEHYVNDTLHGSFTQYDSLGKLEFEEIYDMGKPTIHPDNSGDFKNEEMPKFPGCAYEEMSKEERKKCSDAKVTEYIYSNIKYPMKARELGIQGKALIRFVVNEDGSVSDIKVLNGVSREILKSAVNMVRNMPRWHPGLIDGEPVRVMYTLPISYQLVN